MSLEILILELEHPVDLPVYEAAIARCNLDVIIRAAASVDAALVNCESADVLVAKAHSVSQKLTHAMRRLKWIQALTTGVDHLSTLSLREDILVTNVRGLHGPQMSELAFLYMIALSRDLDRMTRNQRAGVWERWPQRLLYGKTVGIVGVGSISEELAIRCKAFGMTVIGVSSTRKTAAGFDRIIPREDLEELAAQVDILIALTPYSADTHHLISRRVIEALRRDAILINIARGAIVDEAALIEALGSGRIRGAGLDVFEIEPPPPDSPLWRDQNVIMTPRIGGMSDIYAEQAVKILVENIEFFASGRRDLMKNIVKI